jgi:hypothetical protein
MRSAPGRGPGARGSGGVSGRSTRMFAKRAASRSAGAAKPLRMRSNALLTPPSFAPQSRLDSRNIPQGGKNAGSNHRGAVAPGARSDSRSPRAPRLRHGRGTLGRRAAGRRHVRGRSGRRIAKPRRVEPRAFVSTRQGTGERARACARRQLRDLRRMRRYHPRSQAASLARRHDMRAMPGARRASPCATGRLRIDLTPTAASTQERPARSGEDLIR